MKNNDQDLINACNKNLWLKDTSEYPLCDYPYSFKEVDTAEELKRIFEHANWAIRNGYVYKDLAFVQQVNGGDEWLALKKEDGQWKDFESISFYAILQQDGEQEFYNYLGRLETQSIEEYWKPKEQKESKNTIRILKIEPQKVPYEKEMANDLGGIQAEVEGLFQCVYLDDGCVAVCNEEGKINGMELNRRIGNDMIAGPFFIVGDSEDGDFISLTDEQIETYQQQFAEMQEFTGEESEAQLQMTVMGFHF